jgi:hypothetical protein
MAYYLRKERDADVLGVYQRYQEYLRAHQRKFPPSAFALATSEWWQNPQDHRCPHDAWLERITITEESSGSRRENRTTSIVIELLGAYHDGIIRLRYPQVYRYQLDTPRCAGGLGDWRYDEFTLSGAGHVVHEIEWAGHGKGESARWIIEASDVHHEWLEKHPEPVK